jgi:hypothetical protein
MIRIASACLFVSIFALTAAPARAQNLAAQAGAQALARRCMEAGGRPREAAGLVRDVSLGGRAAAALDAQRFTCQGAPPVDCGPFGCKLSIYFDAPTAVFETNVKAWRARGGRLEIVRVGAYCAGPGESCSETYQATGEGLTLAARGTAIFARDAAPRPAASAPVATGARRAARGGARSSPAAARGAGPGASREPRAIFDRETPSARAVVPAQPLSPAESAQRRRRLDAAPYVP